MYIYTYLYHLFAVRIPIIHLAIANHQIIMVNLRYPACLFQADWKLFTSQHTLCIKPTSSTTAEVVPLAICAIEFT